MPFPDIAKKSILALLAGSTVYYMVQRSKNQASPSSLPPPSSAIIDQLHSETDTTPVPIPTTDQPGDMKNDISTAS